MEWTPAMEHNSLSACCTLSNGAVIPRIGYGTWQMPDEIGRAHV